MKRMIAVLAALGVMSLGFAVANLYAGNSSDESAAKMTSASYFEKSYDVGALMGMKVNNEQGVNLGKIEDFVADSHGRIAFAIVSRGGIMGLGEKLVAVPFGVLSYDAAGKVFVLKMDRDKLASAPAYEKKSDLTNSKLVEEIYKFFGQRPYWTEENEGMMKNEGTEPMSPTAH